jgi:hypothetical protein
MGVRRATRRDIVRYFHIENALISIAGVIVGIMLAFGFSGWLMGQFELTRLSPRSQSVDTCHAEQRDPETFPDGHSWLIWR